MVSSRSHTTIGLAVVVLSIASILSSWHAHRLVIEPNAPDQITIAASPVSTDSCAACVLAHQQAKFSATATGIDVSPRVVAILGPMSSRRISLFQRTPDASRAPPLNALV